MTDQTPLDRLIAALNEPLVFIQPGDVDEAAAYRRAARAMSWLASISELTERSSDERDRPDTE